MSSMRLLCLFPPLAKMLRWWEEHPPWFRCSPIRTLTVGLFDGAADSCSSSITAATILQILMVFSSGSAGAKSIVETDDLGPVVDASVAQSNAALVLEHAFVNASSGAPAITEERLVKFIEMLCKKLDGCGRALRLKIISVFSELLVRIPSEVCCTPVHCCGKFLTLGPAVS